MWFILDFLVVAIVLIYVFISAKRGFVRTVVELVGFCLAAYLAFAVGGMIASATYDNAIEPTIVDGVVSAVGETAGGNVQQTVDKIWSALPDLVVKATENFGVTSDSVASTISGQITNNSANITQVAQQTAHAVVRPVIVPLIQTIIGLILFVLLMVLVRFLAKIISKAVKLPLVGGLNQVLGGLLGLGKGLVIAYVACALISTIVYLTPNGFLCFTTENIEQSVLFGFLASLSPFGLA